MTTPVAQPMKPLYEILRLKTPADAKEFIKGLAKFFDDPTKFERYLQGNIIPMSGMIRMSIDIDVKSLLLVSQHDFKEELIQAGLQEYFKGQV